MLNTGWHHALTELVSRARKHVTIAAPFITASAARAVTTVIDPALRDHGRIDIITDLSPAHVCDGALEPLAVQHLLRATRVSSLCHIPRFHAKIYIVDGNRAIVTSANLTAGGFFRNVEYGFEILDPELVATVAKDVAEIRELGVFVSAEQLENYAIVANQVLAIFKRQQTVADPDLKHAFEQATQAADDDLIRLRLAGGGMHTVFAKTIVYILRNHGPLRTEAIHEHIRRIHPELCDDTVDRVIDGQHYGKKWKHAVRTAQQRDKLLGLIKYEAGKWFVANSQTTEGLR